MIRRNITFRKKILFFVFLCGFHVHTNSWTHLYYKMLNSCDWARHTAGNEQLLAKTGISPFTQLIFSWNAFRPQKGHFSFLVQVRNAATKRWSDWHKISEWGSNVQRSYMSNAGDFVRNHFVRLEVNKNMAADAFRIKVKKYNGADISSVSSLAVSASNLREFKSESRESVKSLSSVVIRNVPQISQFSLDHASNDTLCSPTSCSMVVRHLMGVAIDPVHFAENAFDRALNIYGSWPFNMAHAFDVCKGKFSFFTTRLPSFAILHKQLKHGLPVIVSIRGPLEGATRPYKKGHLLVVVGWDAAKKRVICNDPGAQEGESIRRYYPITSFLTAWERSKRLAYLIKPIHEKGNL